MRYVYPSVGGANVAQKTRRYEVPVARGPTGSVVVKAFREGALARNASAQGFMQNLWHVADFSGLLHGTVLMHNHGRAHPTTLTAVEGRASAYSFEWHRRRWTDSSGTWVANREGGSVALWPTGRAVLVPTRERGSRSLSRGEIDGLILINYAAGAYSSFGYAPPGGPASFEPLIAPFVGALGRPDPRGGK